MLRIKDAQILEESQIRALYPNSCIPDHKFDELGWDVYSPPLPEPTPYIPQEVTAFQARAALLQFNLLSQVNALMVDPNTPEIARLAWEYGVLVYRNSPTVASMATALGLSDQQLDDLFIAASQIRA